MHANITTAVIKRVEWASNEHLERDAFLFNVVRQYSETIDMWKQTCGKKGGISHPSVRTAAGNLIPVVVGKTKQGLKRLGFCLFNL